MPDALFHLHVAWISRSDGRSAVAAAAYRAAERLMNEAQAGFSDFRHKAQRTLHAEIVLPPGSPSWAENRAALWNRLEQVEKRKDARLAVEIEFAIPYGVPRTQWEPLARRMAHHYAAQGYAVDFALHTSDDGGNPHVHMMIPMRRMTEDGFAAQKAVELAQRAFVYGARKAWEQIGNQWLASANSGTRLDRRSYKERGIDRPRERHRGADQAERAAKRAQRPQREAEMRQPTREEQRDYPYLVARGEWPPAVERPLFMFSPEERAELKQYIAAARERDGVAADQTGRDRTEEPQAARERTFAEFFDVREPEPEKPLQKPLQEARAERDELDDLRREFFAEPERGAPAGREEVPDRAPDDRAEHSLRESADLAKADTYRHYARMHQQMERIFDDPELAKARLSDEVERLGLRRALQMLEQETYRLGKMRGGVISDKGRDERADAKDARTEFRESVTAYRAALERTGRDADALERYLADRDALNRPNRERDDERER